MSYFAVSFTGDLLPGLIIQMDSSDCLNFPNPHGRILHNSDYGAAKIKHNYDLAQMPKIPGNIHFKSEAIKYRDEKELLTLIQKSHNWSLGDRFILFCQLGSLPLVRYLRPHLHITNTTEKVGLCQASKFGHLFVVKYLLEFNNHSGAKSMNNDALIWATDSGHLEVVKY